MGLSRPPAPARLRISQIITNFMVDFRGSPPVSIGYAPT